MARGNGPTRALLLLLLALLSPDPLRSEDLDSAAFERLKAMCVRGPQAQAARKPFDLNETFGPILRGEAHAEFEPQVLSTDPWVIVFDKFLSEEEMLDIDQIFFAKNEALFQASMADRRDSPSRKSESAFCTGACDKSNASQLVQRRAGAIVRTPTENIDFVQALRYKEGMFYRKHHDNRDSFRYLPCGPRTFTFFVYLTDVEEGGGTSFPKLELAVQPKRGRAVLFQDTRDSDPEFSEVRTEHEALPVTKGLKRGLNVWLYQYEFKRWWAHGCTGITYADMLAGIIKPSDERRPGDTGRPELDFKNWLAESVKVLWLNGEGAEVEMMQLKAGESSSLNTFQGHRFHARALASGELVGEFVSSGASLETFDIERKTAGEL